MASPGFESFKHNRAGYRAVLRSDGVRADLQARADRVRSVVEGQLPAESDGGRPVFILADTTVGRNRAGATVLGVPMRIEADERLLGRAIDAAR